MKSFLEALRGARYLEWFLLVALLSTLGLMLLRNTDAQPSAKLPEEVRLERLLERIDGVGDVDVMIAMDSDGKPSAAAVVAEGLDDICVQLEIQSAIQALLDIDTNRIRVIGKGGWAGSRG